ncbi:MAG: nitrite reductase (NO-forming) [Gammaproteobacteria bacterium]|nr:MAG: nitrite reductase (NO-forming) [Gammaproteobacteria bacterium]TND04992.1 MAG: nitrite reductase (NO-forming) [Gammaproteobacteria bacterium]
MTIMKSALAMAVAAILTGYTGAALAKTVKVTMHANENSVAIDNKGTKYPAWTFDGGIPGPVVRVTEGDVVEFELVNDGTNKESHSMDFHAAIVDVLNEFAPVKPGETKKFKFDAKYPGVFMYHCGSMPMHQHIARGMYGIVIVDPKEGYSDRYPKPDREYVLVQGQFFPNADDHHAIMENQGWGGTLINGKMFHYDPVHDPNASQVLEAKPGERVRIFYVNANVNLPAAIHPIAGVWDRVYANGNPKNVVYGMATYQLGVSEAATLDIVSPADRPTNNAIVDHTMGAAMRGAITVLMNKPDADPKAGKGNLIVGR